MTAADNRELGEPSAALRIDTARLDDYLREHIDGYAGGGEVRQFLGGQSNPTYLIEDASGTYVLRKKPPGKLLPSAHAVDREFRVISALDGSGVPVPRARVLCEDDSVVGQMFYVMDYVPGRVFAGRELPDCSPPEVTAMFESMADVLGALHAVDYEAAGLADYGKPAAYVERQVVRWSKQYEASKIEDCEAMDDVIAWLSTSIPPDDRASLVHGDYRPGNVIFANDAPHVVAVLDWELSTIGHPLADVGYFLMAYRLDAAAFPWGIRGLDLEGIGIPSEQRLRERYAMSAGLREPPATDFYIVFAMFRLAAILAGVLRRGLDGNASDPRAVEQGRAYSKLAAVALSIARNC
ncbi:MAG: phosphotransferase family protein [Woeseiaceae bacterium]|nr:phosphotransferase family protein [Woeseiaceae bacterium]